MRSAIGTGKTVDKAIEDALAKLKCTQDEVTVKVICEGGLFKKAEVELTLDSVAESKIETKIEAPVVKEQPVKAEPVKPQPKPEVKLKEEVKKQEAAAPKKPEIKVHLETVCSAEVKKETKQVEKKPEIKKQEEKKPAAKNLPAGHNREVVEKFLTELLKFSAAKNVKVVVTEEDAHFKASVTGDMLSSLIGSGGETMQAIETVLNIISAKNREQNKRVMLDVGDYRKGKCERLQELAENAARKVRESKQPFRMKPMNNRERRIVHSHLQVHKDLKTFSKGEDPNRYIIVAPAGEGRKEKVFEE